MFAISQVSSDRHVEIRQCGIFWALISDEPEHQMQWHAITYATEPQIILHLFSSTTFHYCCLIIHYKCFDILYHLTGYETPTLELYSFAIAP